MASAERSAPIARSLSQNTINCASHCPPSFKRYLNARLQKVAYSAIWFNYLRVLPHDLDTDAKVICDLHDFQTDRIEADVLPRLRADRRDKYLQSFRSSELRALNQCDLAIAISSVEIQRIIKELDPQACMACVPATDFMRVPLRSNERSEPEYDLLFVGSRSDANFVGLAWFLRDCLKRITDELPQVRFRIHGAITELPTLRKLVAQLPNRATITLTGPSETMDEVYASSQVIICPIRHGTGMKIKMIEAMAYGKAIVATGKAGEGIATDLGLEFVDTSEAFADSCVQLLRDANARALRERSAMATFARDHEHARLGERLMQLLAELGIHVSNR